MAACISEQEDTTQLVTQQKRKKTWHADLFLLLNLHNTETTINHTNGSGHRATHVSCCSDITNSRLNK